MTEKDDDGEKLVKSTPSLIEITDFQLFFLEK